ncbi:MAG: hypothetical protein R3A12_06880 [Ignavibacteria bacterium]
MDVKTHWHPEEGFFGQSSEKIAEGLKSASDSLAQAMDRLDFYINRAGSNLISVKIKKGLKSKGSCINFIREC